MSIKNFGIQLYVYALLFFCSASNADVVFHDALPCDGTSFSKSPEEQEASNSLSKVFREQGISIGGRCLGWTNAGGDNVWFTAVEGLGILSVDVSQNKLLGVWPITRSSHQYFFNELKEQYGFIGLDYPVPFNQEYKGLGVGCQGNKPVRYVYLDSDDRAELVVILNNLVIIFSPDYNRTIFSEYFNASDWLTGPEMADRYGDRRGVLEYQYASKLLADNDRFGPALRAYSKLYFGDFDKDGSQDILVWRKLYKTNDKDESLEGFSKERDSYQHFEQNLSAQAKSDAGVTGEYIPQETEAATVVQWLVDNALTWQKGYPSRNECAAQQGELIPEMHDSLLNDPDVLQ
ncbi:hypothetical protein Maes01_02810 [Microbulbifer aestuariivivens]|uniref:Uncharacterized protein n=1 Tax=Microbulbifer aestuariivivens TaxID=1908308 RepID=A0ABP9WW11_9GAMM